MLESLKMRVLLDKRYNLAKPLLFGKSVDCLAKDMEKEKAECENSPTLNDQYVRDRLGKV